MIDRWMRVFFMESFSILNLFTDLYKVSLVASQTMYHHSLMISKFQFYIVCSLYNDTVLNRPEMINSYFPSPRNQHNNVHI